MKTNKIEIGMGVTIVPNKRYGVAQDRDPGTIIDVISPKTVMVQFDSNDRIVEFKKNNRGDWKSVSNLYRMWIGKREMYRDPQH